MAAPIWRAFMDKILKDTPVEIFKKPKPVKTSKPILNGKFEVEQEVKVDSVTQKVIPKECLDQYPKEFISIKKVKSIHDTLFWVDKNDPRGPEPKDPKKIRNSRVGKKRCKFGLRKIIIPPRPIFRKKAANCAIKPMLRSSRLRRPKQIQPSDKVLSPFPRKFRLKIKSPKRNIFLTPKNKEKRSLLPIFSRSLWSARLMAFTTSASTPRIISEIPGTKQ